MTKKGEPGSVNMKNIQEALKTIEILTDRFKRRRMTSDSYLSSMNECLSKITTERNYTEYLKNIGQY
jgi:hypothetical protein